MHYGIWEEAHEDAAEFHLSISFPRLGWGGCRLLMIHQTFLVTIIWCILRLDEIENPSSLFPSSTDQGKIPLLASFDKNKHLHPYSLVSCPPFLQLRKNSLNSSISDSSTPDDNRWRSDHGISSFVQSFLHSSYISPPQSCRLKSSFTAGDKTRDQSGLEVHARLAFFRVMSDINWCQNK